MAADLRQAAELSGIESRALAQGAERCVVEDLRAHRAVGALVRRAEAQGWSLAELPPHVLAAAHPAFGNGNGAVSEPAADDRLRISPEASVEARSTLGGTSRRVVLEQLRQAREAVAR